ncbi:unnamed protein product [Protopolystoma xenopodis]|uniref:Uncharacterized protein n=1 Tax=Protopolystoma xenopodis TaxID=117903 RepID=A0A448XB31_9PLAT|nr:unnamed protein product [Protopolystoma xenopodis]
MAKFNLSFCTRSEQHGPSLFDILSVGQVLRRSDAPAFSTYHSALIHILLQQNMTVPWLTASQRPPTNLQAGCLVRHVPQPPGCLGPASPQRLSKPCARRLHKPGLCLNHIWAEAVIDAANWACEGRTTVTVHLRLARPQLGVCPLDTD